MRVRQEVQAVLRSARGLNASAGAVIARGLPLNDLGLRPNREIIAAAKSPRREAVVRPGTISKAHFTVWVVFGSTGASQIISQ